MRIKPGCIALLALVVFLFSFSALFMYYWPEKDYWGDRGERPSEIDICIEGLGLNPEDVWETSYSSESKWRDLDENGPFFMIALPMNEEQWTNFKRKNDVGNPEKITSEAEVKFPMMSRFMKKKMKEFSFDKVYECYFFESAPNIKYPSQTCYLNKYYSPNKNLYVVFIECT